jgi:5-amino-6-(5-phosphoribosylamino)uracil reductase
MNRPHITVILAMSADGKIADAYQSAARFASATDKMRLEKHLSRMDAALFGANTLRAYHTSLPIRHPDFLAYRQQQGLSPQPIQIVCSSSGNFDPQMKFFQQPFPRWLITAADKVQAWENRVLFERILVCGDWKTIFTQFTLLGIQKLAILGGGELIASLLTEDFIDEIYLTICPLLLGGNKAATPLGGTGFLADYAKKLQLLSVETIEQEIFLHYRLDRAAHKSQN